MARRAAIFLLLGPAIGGFPFLLFGMANATLFLVILVITYFIGIIPAAIAWMFDAVTAERIPDAPRILACAVVGALASIIPFLLSAHGDSDTSVYWLLATLGAFAAAVCSALSSVWSGAR